MSDQTNELQGLRESVDALRDFTVKSFWATLDQVYAVTLPQRTIECIVCGHRDRHDGFETIVDECMFGGGRLERYHCPDCECVFGPQKFLDLPEALCTADYRLLYDHYAEANSVEQEVRTFRSLGLETGQRALNWGCGAWSETIQQLRGDGQDVWGFEPHAPTSDPFVVNDLGYVREGLDGIFSNNVIEHLRQPVEQLREMASLLRPGGVMAHSTPCYEYRYGFTRFHTLFLLGNSPHRLAERAGLEVVREERSGEYGNVVFRRPVS